MLAKDMPLNTIIEIPAEQITLRRSHGRKPWRQPVGRLRFGDDAVQASLDAGEAEVITYGEVTVAAV
jgi:hypothetical protein